MKHTNFFIVFFALLSWQLNAQQPAANYGFTETTEVYTAITGTNSTATGDDGSENTITFPFPFKFEGVTYANFSINTNGFIRLGNTIGASSWTNSLGNTAVQRPLIAPFWDDNNRNAGSIQYAVSGTSPNQILEIGWDNVNIGGGGSTSTTLFASFKIRLHETTNIIEFIYGTIMDNAGTLTASVGINGTATFLSVTPMTSSTVSNVTANNTISSTVDLVGKKFIFTPPAPPSCSAPSALTATNLTSTSADLGWTENGTATTWDIEWGTAGFTPTGTPNITGTTTNPHNLIGLTANTAYEFYVRADCGGANGVSTWAGPFSFFTGYCTPSSTQTTTYIDNFSTTGGSLNISNLSSGFTTGGYLDASAQIVESFATGSFTFNAEIVGGTAGFSIWVDWNNDLIFDNLTEKVFNTTGFVNGPFTASITIPTGTAIGNYRMRTTVDWNASNPANPCAAVSRGEFEDYTISIVAPPACLAPSVLTATNITSTSADLGWTENGTATTWDIEWGTAGFTPTGTPNITGTTTNPHNLSGLTANTTYEFYVRADCGGANGVSTWAGPFSFTTACSFMIAPWIENFENAGTISNCWNQGVANAENWIFSNTGAGNHIGNNGTITGTTTSGNFFAWVDDSAPHSLLTTLESPFVDVSALTTPMLSFYLISNNEGFTNVNFSVDVWDGAAWNVGFFTSNSNTFAGGWEKINVNLSTLTITGNIKFRFVVDETNGSDFYDDVAIDDVEVKEAPLCVDPSALTATNILPTSADLGWTENGTATTWDIEWGTAGFTPTGTPTIVGTTTNPHNLTGLTSNTTYEFYVRADCGGTNGVSSWAGPFSFFTGYCTPAPTSVDGDGITNVTVGSINNTTGAEVGNYGDYSNLVTNIAQGTTVTVNITYETGFAYDTKIWIDWNDDLDFLDAGEEVYVGTSLANNPTTLVASFLVPLTATLGNHRMRIGGQDVGPAQQCYTGSWGTFEDYTVNVTIAPSCLPPSALTATNLTSTSADLGWTENGTATIWDIEWGTAGFTPTGTPTIVGTTTNPHNLTGLTSNTTYEFYVRADCGGTNGVSTWAGPFSFTTSPDFCAGDHFYDNGGPTGNYANNSNDTTIICPSVPGGFVTATFLAFDTEAGWDDLTIFNGSGVFGTSFGTFDGTTIPGPFTSTDITGCLTFVFESDGSVTRAGWDAEITCSAPVCSDPSNLTAFNIQPTSAMLDWTENGTATNWNIEWDVTGFALGTGNPQAVPAKPYLLQGLTPGTSYDYYVQANCGNDSSAWVGPFTFSTPPCMPIALNLGADTTVCSTDTLTLDAGAGPFIYNWSFGATTQIVNLDTSIFGGNGTYPITVVVTDINTGCVYQDIINVTFSTCVGIDEKTALLDFNIYPNPNKGQFTIKLNNKNSTNLRISVTNVQGQEVFVKNNFDNVNVINEQINIGDVKSVYFVNIITDKEVITKKVIVQ